MSNVEPRTLKGFKDYLPEEQKARQKIVDTCREVFELYGFLPTDTPALEYADILENKIGEDEKLIYKFEDRGGREVAMRYDLTVPLARMVSQYQNELKFPFRRYQIGTVWRADNPQKGRYREFMQADADIVGTESLAADAEMIAMYYEIFTRLGIGNFKIYINSRKVFDALLQTLKIAPDQSLVIVRAIDKYDSRGAESVTGYLDENGVDIEVKEKVEKYLAIAESEDILASLGEFLNSTPESEEALADFASLKKYLEDLNVPESAFAFDPRIARGLDYYTGIIFETIVSDSDVGSIGSGGRYDKLVESFSNRAVPAVGMSIGVDRLLTLMIEKKLAQPVTGCKVLIMNMGEEFTQECLKLLSKLRGENISAQYFYENKDLEKQFKYAEELNIPYGILIGEDEIKSSQYSLRDLKTREQKKLNFEEVTKELKEK